MTIRAILRAVLVGLCLAATACGAADPGPDAAAETSGDAHGGPDAQAPDGLALDVDWAAFLGRNDATWEHLSDRWQDGAFTGNGLLGTMTYRKDARTLRFRLGRSDVTAHYRVLGVDWSVPRVPIGDLLLSTAADVRSESARLHLHDAEVTGEIATDLGTVRWRVLTHAADPVIVLETTATGQEHASLTLAPAWGISPRIVSAQATVDPARLPPQPACETHDGVETCVQTLLPGGDYATAWRTVEPEPGHDVAYLSVADGWPSGGAAASARAAVADAAAQGMDALVASHRAWWHAYWPASFVSLPDARWESFYWLQMYKHASATRPGRPLIDNQGPWLTETPWPGTWWNLNVQLSYLSVATANRAAQGSSLIEALAGHVDSLQKNASPYVDAAHVDRYTSLDLVSWLPIADVTKVIELGNLVWALHDVWRIQRTTMDDALLRDSLFPLLRLAVNLYLRLLKEGDDGRLHLPPTHSPEYGDSDLPKLFADCTYALSLLRWGCQALLDANDHLALHDPLEASWRDVLARTVLPTDADGLRIGADQPFDRGHRHFSHLLAAFPLGLLRPEVAADRALIETSLAHWLALGERDGGLEGYSWMAASSMASFLGRGDDALGYLERLAPRFEPATMYVEAGPVIETPLATAEALHLMLLQAQGGVIRVFPALPSTWNDAAFCDLAVEGGFRVSAVREGGRVRFVRVKSLSGEPLRLSAGLGARALASGDVQGLVTAEADGTWLLSLGAGQEVVLLPEDADATASVVRPVARAAGDEHPYGLKAPPAAR